MPNRYKFDLDECNRIMSFGRNALDTYTIENQRMDVGSVDDLLNMKGGIILLAESNKGLSRIRGNACIVEGQRIADSIIDAMIRCASVRSVGSEIKKSEARDVVFKMSIIEEVIITDEPVKDLELGTDTYYLNGSDGNSWIYPTKPVEYNWDKKEFLRRTCKKSGYNPDYWKNDECVLLRTRSCVEKNPGGNVEFTKISEKL
jgi:AMMECR1 domain-containing protein